LKRIVTSLKNKYGARAVAACAPTGVAAILCGGQTLHSLAGCGIANTLRDLGKMWKDVNRNRCRALILKGISIVTLCRNCTGELTFENAPW
jgi:hypothetical protein